jgi:aspartokinase
VLTGPFAYRQAAAFLGGLASTDRGPIVAVVSAEKGHTDALLDEARRFAGEPERAPLDLLWSTGELRSVALLTLSLRAAGVPAAGFNAHEAGLVAHADRMTLILVLRAALTRHRWSPPGAATRDQQVVISAAVARSQRCLSPGSGARCADKDVDGYHSRSDPDPPRASFRR